MVPLSPRAEHGEAGLWAAETFLGLLADPQQTGQHSHWVEQTRKQQNAKATLRLALTKACAVAQVLVATDPTVGQGSNLAVSCYGAPPARTCQMKPALILLRLYVSLLVCAMDLLICGDVEDTAPALQM